MPANGTQPQVAECSHFPEAVRLLWEATQKAVEEWGTDRSDLVSLCDIIVRLAEHRLLVIASCGSPPASEQIAEQVRHYRQLASDLRQWAAKPPPEPDWAKVADKLLSADAAPLDITPSVKE
jgi:hypothetical protein